MTEKILIKTCVRKDTQKGTFYTIELSDGRKGMSSDDLTSKIGSEIEVDVKEGNEYNGEKQYYFNIPKVGGQQAGKFPAKDWTYEKRRASLECAINTANLMAAKVDSAQILQVAEKYFEYLNKK